MYDLILIDQAPPAEPPTVGDEANLPVDTVPQQEPEAEVRFTATTIYTSTVYCMRHTVHRVHNTGPHYALRTTPAPVHKTVRRMTLTTRVMHGSTALSRPALTLHCKIGDRSL